MGVRLNTVDPMNQVRPSAVEKSPPVNPISVPSQQSPELPDEMTFSSPTAQAARGEESSRASSARADVLETSSSSTGPQPHPDHVDQRTPLSHNIRRFRFLMAPENIRDQELNARQQQLEQRLESLNSRLRSTGSLISEIDLRLERAQVEKDIEEISSKIRQLRLETSFNSRVAAPDEAHAAQRREIDQTNYPEAASPESVSEAHLNLIA